MPRLRWSLAEFERLTELGFFTEDDRIELIGGELDAVTLATRVHRTLAPEGYGDVRTMAANERLVPLLIPSLAVTISGLRTD